MHIVTRIIPPPLPHTYNGFTNAFLNNNFILWEQTRASLSRPCFDLLPQVIVTCQPRTSESINVNFQLASIL